MSFHLLAIGGLAVVAVLAVGYWYLQKRLEYMSGAMDHQGLVIGIKKEQRVGEGDVDLDEVLYEPLLAEIELWNREPPIFNEGAFLPWEDLKDERPDVVEQEVPDDLQHLLDEAADLSAKVTSLRGIVSNMTVAELKEQGDKLKDDAGIQGKGGTKLRVMVDGEWSKYLELSGIWLTGLSLPAWARDYVEREHPDAEEWEVEVLVADERAGSTAEADAIAQAVFEWLETKEIAVNLREETEQLARMGAKIEDRIEAARG